MKSKVHFFKSLYCKINKFFHLGIYMKLFFSLGFAIFLMCLFAIVCAIATFLETLYDTQTAWAIVYKAPWFGFIMLLLGINIAYNIFRFKLANFKKLPSFLFHFSFIFILFGAVMTRYHGFEGIMHIRENESSNKVISSEKYIQISTNDSNNQIVNKNVIDKLNFKGKRNFDISFDIDGKKAILTYKDFIKNGEISMIENENQNVKAEPMIKFLFSNSTNKRDVVIKSGDYIQIADIDFTFNTKGKQEKQINITSQNGKFYINSNVDIVKTDMKNMEKSKFEKNATYEIADFNVFSLDGINFAPIFMLNNPVKKVVKLPENEHGNDAIIAELEYDGEKQEVFLLDNGKFEDFDIKNKKFYLSWGGLNINLPFEIKLKDFKLERYPGSNSPSGYKSEVLVSNKNTKLDYEIYMNHVLDFGGYRFFQNSYDYDEKGTILSVNKDPGKIPTYIGYALLCLGMFLNFFNPNSRFLKLSKLINQSATKNAIIALFVLFLTTTTPLKATQNPNFDKEHLDNLKTLVVQGFDGRMEPFDTLSMEVLTKIYKSNNFKFENGEKLNHNGVMLSFIVNPEFWQQAKIIKINDDELKKLLGISKDEKYAKMDDFFAKDEQNKPYYKLAKFVEEINRKPFGNRSVLDKEIMKVDERVNVFYYAFIGKYFRVIPKQNAINNEWISPSEIYNLKSDENKEISNILGNYFQSVIEAQKDGNWKKADVNLQKLKDYQSKFGNDIIPTQTAINMEILLNKLNIFNRLIFIYVLAGAILMIFIFMSMINEKMNIKKPFKFVYFINLLAFFIHTFGLILRWYISGHAPWSNSYESMIYIAWALALSGIIFSKKSAISLSLTAILAGITLLVAFMAEMDPQITNIQPVLKSHWLTIHVSVITASYGFFGLCWLLGIFTLILFVLQNSKNHAKIAKSITESTRINEMSMILGLCLLTVGNFLGGVWANESWGRYWGWDSKETWALITILIYACVVHFRFVKFLNSQFAFAVASILSFFTVLMTYFGVNYYLTGMHSYASGEKIPVPFFVWILLGFIAFLILISWIKKRDLTRL